VTVDEAYSSARQIIETATANLEQIKTEEDAKLQIITRLLTEALGWKHTDISAEQPNENGFSDYVVSRDGQAAFVLEAKKVGAITIATHTSAKSHYKISGPVLKPAIEGIRQAASYCHPLGIQLGVLTDGILWIVFLPWVPDDSYTERQAIVFPSFEVIVNDFSLLYELLSAEHLAKKTFRVIFDAIHENRLVLDRHLSSPMFSSDNRIMQKSGLSFDLESVFDGFFAGLSGENDTDMLIDCFVETRESKIADFSLERLTKNVLGNIDPNERDVGAGLQTVVQSAVTGQRGQTVFIVGPSGAGKSTFLDRFFARTLAPEVREKCIIIKLDVLDATGDETALLPWITEQSISAIEAVLYDEGMPSWADLQGLYHLEYLRRLKGVDADLYDRDKNAFKNKFAGIVEDAVAKDREGYLRRLLADIVKNRKRLPVFVIDNTDEFEITFKTKVFQYFQALRREIEHCLLVFPATDRSAWSFANAEIFNIYSSKSFYLPTPAPREVFSKRVDYMRTKKAKESARSGGGEYLTVSGIRLKIGNLEAFASVIESVFVNQDYPAKQVGEFSNYNMRKALGLAKRIITSSVLNLEDLVKSYFTGEMVAPSPIAFASALVKGDYMYFKPGDEPLLFPIFQVDNTVVQSPLLNMRVLTLLSDLNRTASLDDHRYMTVNSILAYFGVMSVPEASTQRALEGLLAAGLLEPYDLSKKSYSEDQRLAITHSGRAHLSFAMYNPVFFEQLALTTGIPDSDAASQVRGAAASNAPARARYEQVRELFAAYICDEDQRHVHVPERNEFRSQRALRDDIRSRWVSANDAAEDRWRLPEVVADAVDGIIDDYDRYRGFGFVDIPSLKERAFLHTRVLEQSDFQEVFDGDRVVCDVKENEKGLIVSKVHAVSTEAGQRASGQVVKTFSDRSYGFIHVPDLGVDAMFHHSVISPEIRHMLREGTAVEVELNFDGNGRAQVRKLLGNLAPQRES
jgi:cold shock CspA family protein/energy-coupling factor transporter ATP-binding protein EcfA2